MKYYSEELKKIFDTEEDLKAAEDKHAALQLEEQKKKEAKAARLKEIEEAYKECEKASEAYNKLIDAFVKDYGYYHTTVTKSTMPKSFYDFFLNYWPW